MIAGRPAYLRDTQAELPLGELGCRGAALKLGPERLPLESNLKQKRQSQWVVRVDENK